MTEKRALTLKEILSSIDADYLGRITERIGSIALRSQIDASRLGPRELVRVYLSDKKVVTGIYRTLSEEAYKIASLVIASGGSLSADTANPESDLQKYGNAVSECVEKLALFLIPGANQRLTVCVPVEYLIIGAGPSDMAESLSLVGALRRCDSNTIREMCKALGLESGGKSPANAADVFSHVTGSGEELIRRLEPEEAEVIDWMFERNGLAFPEDFAERFYPKEVARSYGRYSFDYDFMGTRYHHSAPQPHSVLFLRGLLIEFPVQSEFTSSRMVALPSEIYEMLLARKIGSSDNERNARDSRHHGLVKTVAPENGFFMMLRKVAVALLFGSRRGRKPGIPVLSELSGCSEYYTSLVLNFLDISQMIAEESEGAGRKDPREAMFALFSKPEELVRNVSRYFLLGLPEDGLPLTINESDFILTVMHRILSRLFNTTDAVAVSSLISMLVADRTVILASRTQCVELMERERTERILRYEKGITEVPPVADIVRNLTLSLLSSLYIIGALSLDREPPDANAFVSLSAFGRDVLSGTVEDDVLAGLREKQTHLIVQPDLEILADIFSDLRDLETLAAFSEEVRIDRLCRFRLTRKSITACVNAGTAPENIRSFLKERSASGIPATLDRMLSDVGEKIGEIKLIRCQAIIKTKDKFIAEELVRKKSLSRYLEGKLTDDIILVKEGTNLNSFLASIKKAGYVPWSED